MPDSPKVSAELLMAEGRFLSFKALKWTDAKGVERIWETADRAKGTRAVVIVPRLVPSGRLLLIKQYRPPARGVVIEFPAGLLENGESPEEGVRRELAEETGYVAKSLTGGLPALSSPGMTDETVHFFIADVDENAPENQAPKTSFDPGEMIETVLVPVDDLARFCEREFANGALLDGKVLAFAGALSMRR